MRLSFIVPCHNVERYIGYCLGSILSCDLPSAEYEVLCVNDCSSDSTLAILNHWASQYSQIHVINLYKNLGPSAARNIALLKATGKYIWYIDSDDSISYSVVNNLLRKAESNSLDVLIFNFDRQNERRELISESLYLPDSGIYEGTPFIKQVMKEMFYQNFGYVWRFLYLKDFLLNHDLLFPEGVIWEDTLYVPRSIIEAKKIASSSFVGYHYLSRQTSFCNVMAKTYPSKWIFDYVFHAGYDLLIYSQSVKDYSIRSGIYDFSKQYYLFHNFILYLLRTSAAERKNFYRIVKNERSLVDRVKKEMKIPVAILLMPFIGIIISNTISCIYKLKKWIFN